MTSLRTILRHRDRAASRAGVLAIAFLAGAAITPIDTASARDGRNWMERAWSGNSWDPGLTQRTEPARQAATLRPGSPTLSRNNIAPMESAIARYARIVENGGWQPIPEAAVKRGLRTGSSGQMVERLRQRLIITGDLRYKSAYAGSFDYYVREALMRFQRRHGLEPTGDLVDRSRRRRNGMRTLLALNVPAQARLRQLRANLRRISKHSRNAGNRYVMVNIPAAQVEAVENDRVVSRHAAVIGKPERATPILTSRIHEINFNPVWTLPPTVIRKDLIPKGRRMAASNESVLSQYGIDAYSRKTGRKLDPHRINWNTSQVYNLVYRQEPGPENPLGFVKINFHNKHAVYMHDTPSKSLFGQSFRAASSGCVRINNIETLVSWLLEGNGGWPRHRVAAMKRGGARHDIRLKSRTRVHFVYITAWATEAGDVNFRRDIYGHDQRYGVSRTASRY